MYCFMRLGDDQSKFAEVPRMCRNYASCSQVTDFDFLTEERLPHLRVLPSSRKEKQISPISVAVYISLISLPFGTQCSERQRPE